MLFNQLLRRFCVMNAVPDGGGGGGGGDSLREALSASLTQLESSPPAAPAPEPAPAAPAPSPVASAPVVATPAPPAPAPAPQEGVQAPAAAGPERNPDGTFKAKDPIAPAAAPAAPAAPAAQAPGADPNAPAAAPAPASMATTQKYDRAPHTWSPEAREHWATIAPEVREQIWKRDIETTRALSHSAQARKFAQEFDQIVQPYMGFIAAENSTPLQAFQFMMQTGALLRVGTPAQKAQAVAQIVQQYNIDIGTLDQVLAGQQVQDNPAALVQREVRAALAPFQQQLQQRQQAQQTQIDTQVDSDLQAFATDPKNEFFEDVREVMGDIIQIALKRGQHMSLTEAYERATLLHEPVRRVLDARKAQATAQQSQQIAQAARNAAVSVTPSAVSGTTHETSGDSIRDAINFALNKSTQG